MFQLFCTNLVLLTSLRSKRAGRALISREDE